MYFFFLKAGKRGLNHGFGSPKIDLLARLRTLLAKN